MRGNRTKRIHNLMNHFRYVVCAKKKTKKKHFNIALNNVNNHLLILALLLLW